VCGVLHEAPFTIQCEEVPSVAMLREIWRRPTTGEFIDPVEQGW
jgi:hypothetical protein